MDKQRNVNHPGQPRVPPSRRPDWFPPTQDHPSPPPPPAEPARVQVEFDRTTLGRLGDLEGKFRDLEEAIRNLSWDIERLKDELDDLKELIRESGGSAADSGSRSQP